MPELDHLVLAVPDLDAAVLDLARRTGVQPVTGGRHPGRGTRNALVGLSWAGDRRHYLELLARDPDQPDVPEDRVMLGAGPVLRGGAPRMHAWAVRVGTGELDGVLARARAAGVEVGEPVAAARQTPGGGRLSWRLAVPEPLGLGGVQPFLIEWEDTHPTDAPLPTFELVSLTLQHPEPERAAEVLRVLGVDLPVGHADRPRIAATFATPEGEVLLG